MSWRIAVALLLGAASIATAQPKEEAEIALIGATIHPVSGPARQGTVLLRGGKIRAIGKFEVAAGTKTIDLTGRHLYPGLIDADTVLGLTEIGSVKGSQDTREVGQINPNLRAERAINPDSELFPVARTGGVLFAHVVARSGWISGTSALIYTAGKTYEDMTVRAPLLLHVRWPRMRIERRGKTSDQITKATAAREAVLKGIAAAFREARAYASARVLDSSTRPRDPKWEAMLPVVAPSRRGRRVRVAVHAQTQAQIEAALDWGRRERLKLVIVGGADAWRVATQLHDQDVPVILSPVQRLPRRAHESVETAYRVAARLQIAKVRFAFSTGGSGFEAANARNLRLHAAQAVGYDLPPEAALRALTLGAAEILGLGDRLGSVEVGKEATLIATDRPLLEDTAQISHAWIRGRAVSLDTRQLKLYERFRKRDRK
ncbi:MAG: amidohydrolase family protein [Planctomycetes bacterium]|nr:amidohydrolase family protein [Planctomycetota bacterium]